MTELKNVAQVKENIERDYLQKLNVERNRKNWNKSVGSIFIKI